MNTKKDALNVLPKLAQFIGPSQMRYLRDNFTGEERQFFIDLVVDLAVQIEVMPKTYEQDGKCDDAIVYLHYFTRSSQWWILEKDREPEQLQAFGYACINGDVELAELGYIPIVELLECGAELDFYFEPRPLSKIKEKLFKDEN